jgi:radical SAM protein with 4Fe4S-binding SPASM domain
MAMGSEAMGWRQRLTQAKVLAGIAHGSRGFGGPYQASLNLSNRCNLRCIHCYFYSPLLRVPNFFDVRQARGRRAPMPARQEVNGRQLLDADAGRTRVLLDELLHMGTWRFHFSGSGEPFMHRDAIEFMARVKHAGRECIVNTNGTFLDAASAEALVAMGLDEVRVTTMAGTADLYERTHPGSRPGTLERLREGLRALSERKAAAGARRPAVNLVYVVVRQNVEGLADFARFAHEVGADGVILQPMDDVGDSALAEVVPTEPEAAAVVRQLPEVKRLLDERGLRHNLDRFEMVFNRGLDTRALYRIIPCYMGWISLRVQVGGDVHPCHRCYDPVGNVSEKSMAEVWNGPAYRRFRRESAMINKRGSPVEGCSCGSCCHYATNVRVFRRLHPLSGWLRTLRQLWPAAAATGGDVDE